VDVPFEPGKLYVPRTTVAVVAKNCGAFIWAGGGREDAAAHL